jgi:hypothetical protein
MKLPARFGRGGFFKQKGSDKNMILRVHPSIPLPFVVLIKGEQVFFNPDAEVPDDWGKSALTSYPGRFTVAEGKADMSKYKVKESFVQKQLFDLIASLNEEQKGKTYEFIEKLKNSERTADARKKFEDEESKKKALAAEGGKKLEEQKKSEREK